MFSGRYFKRTFGWGLRPITRDGAQSLIFGYPLWGVTDSSVTIDLEEEYLIFMIKIFVVFLTLYLVVLQLILDI